MQAHLPVLGPLRRRGWLALAAAALLGLAGCGGGGEEPGRDAVQAGADPATTLYRASFVGGYPGNARGEALNASGQVAGILQGDFDQGSGFLFDGASLLTYDTPGGIAPRVLDLSDAGQVVGSLRDASGATEAYSWTGAGGLVRIAPLSAKVRGSVAYDANASGQVAGTLQRYDGSSQGFVWSASTGLVTAFGEAGTRLAAAYQINDAGQIAGEMLSGGERRPVLVDAASGAVTFVAPPGWGSVSVIPLRPSLWLNEAGDVAGTLGERAFLRRGADGAFTDLDAAVREGLQRERPGYDDAFGTYVVALNAEGEAMVNITLGVKSHFWSRATGFVGIWPPASDDYSLLSLNRHGVAVGWSDPEFALAWTRGSGAVDLNPRTEGLPQGLRLREAVAVNDRGQILARAEHVLGEGRATVLLTPVAQEGAGR